MKALVQRVTRARVTVEGRVTGEIGAGLLVLLGAAHGDGEEQAAWLARKLAGLRVFADAEGHMNLDLRQVGGAALVVPQFTLLGDARRGRRPDFTGAAPPALAAPLYERFCALLEAEGVPVQRGVFGAHMAVELLNDGPVTLLVETPGAGAERGVSAPRREHGALFYAGRSPVVLASASPRRVTLLRQVGLVFAVADPGPDREWPGAAEPRHGVRALALEKARRVAARRPEALVIGADTVVVARGVRLGKPRGEAEALEMLRRLQGRTHEVWTGLAVVRGGEQRTAAEVTKVQFARLDEEELRAYARTGEPLDKAGAYGIQGLAAQLVRRIEGDYTNVVGLPLARLRQLLKEFA